jgi:protein tyrosine/serine phosphatase
MTQFERKWTLDGVENFRDYGGYATADGRRVKTGRLFRSAHHGAASAADLERLDALGLSALVDLRRTTERNRMPSQRGPGFKAQVILNDLDDQDVDSFHAHLIESDQSVEAMRAYLRDYYRHAPLERRHIDLYRRYFQVLAEADGPVLIHCAAGKDRTGILAALTHRLLGVGDEDMMADYLLTNDAERMERRAPLFAAWVQDLTGRTPSKDAMFASMGVEAEYLRIAFAAIEAEYGSVEAYLEQALGVDAALKARIEERLLD